MGFVLPQRKAKLVFEDEFKGATVRVVLDQPLGALIEAQKLQEESDLTGLCRFVASILLDWNLEKDGTPTPATEKGLLTVTPAFIDALVTAWVNAQTETSPKKGKKSKGGAA